jgi:hypothetical protein
MRWAKHVAGMAENINSCIILVRKAQGKRIFNLFIVHLTTLSVDQTIQRRMIGWIMNWEEYRRKWSWLNWNYCPGICLEGLRKNINNLSQNSRSPGIDLNPGPSEYEGVLTTQPWSSVESNFKIYLREIVCEVANRFKWQVRIKWRAVVNTVMNIWASWQHAISLPREQLTTAQRILCTMEPDNYVNTRRQYAPCIIYFGNHR